VKPEEAIQSGYSRYVAGRACCGGGRGVGSVGGGGGGGGGRGGEGERGTQESRHSAALRRVELGIEGAKLLLVCLLPAHSHINRIIELE
jgi:hypothetical protein